MAEYRVFTDNDPNCIPGMHEVGDRHVSPGSLAMEWTADRTWTVVCPECDVAMLGRDPDDYLACEKCGLRANEAVPQ